MKTEIKMNNHVATATLDGCLDTIAAESFLAEITPLFQETGLRIVLDCEKLTYISSSGLRAFLLLQKNMSRNHGEVVVEKLRPDVLKIFELSGFTKLITIMS